MKKIIAAALSILVGAFGYTIVDSTIENRVSRLESKVYILEAEASKYHSTIDSSENPSEPDEIYIGKKLDNHNFKTKFLIRIHDDGRVEYISPQNYSEAAMVIAAYDVTTEIDLRDPRETTTFDTRDPRETTCLDIEDPRDTTVSGLWLPNWYEDNSYSSAPMGDYFVYLDTVSAVIIDANFKTTHYYDDNYSLASKSLCSDFTLAVTYQGKTDPALAGEKIKFTSNFFGGYGPAPYSTESISNNTINPDGSFNYTQTFIGIKANYISLAELGCYVHSATLN